MSELREIPPEIRDWIGKTLVEEHTDFEIELGYVATTCASVQNGNPIFWDRSVADSLTQGPIAPPTMLSVWMRPHAWAPDRTEEKLPLEVHFRLKKELELPEAVITGNEMSFGEPVRPGDRLTVRQTLQSISEPKTNRLGTGRYWVIDVEYRNQRGEWVGTDSYNCFGYRRD